LGKNTYPLEQVITGAQPLSDAKKPSPNRHYPAIYEKLIPVAMAAICIAIVILLAIIVIVLAGAR
jgi:hypothetical protein